MKKLKLISLIVAGALVLSLAACGGNNQSATSSDVQTEVESVETTDENTEEVALTGVKVEPLPNTVSLDNLDDTSVAVLFEGKDVEVDGETTAINVRVYSHEIFDNDAIKSLAIGDIVVVEGNEVVVTDVKKGDIWITINGGLTEGGHDFAPDETSGGYHEQIMDLGAKQILVGETKINLGEGFEFVDKSDLDNIVAYTAEEFVNNFKDTDQYFSEHATTVTFKDGQVISMVRNYLP